MKIRDFYYSNSLGKYLLLQFIAVHGDQVKEIHMINIHPDDHPETWINDTFWGANGKIINREWVPTCMGRIIQVESMTGIDVGEGNISIKVTDQYCDWNNKIFKLESENGILSVSEIDEYDCEVTIQGLSAIIYGSYNLDDFEYKGWGKISKENQKKIEKLFPQKSPFLHADF
jgi:predicted acetyltransferase